MKLKFRVVRSAIWIRVQIQYSWKGHAHAVQNFMRAPPRALSYLRLRAPDTTGGTNVSRDTYACLLRQRTHARPQFFRGGSALWAAVRARCKRSEVLHIGDRVASLLMQSVDDNGRCHRIPSVTLHVVDFGLADAENRNPKRKTRRHSLLRLIHFFSSRTSQSKNRGSHN